MYSTCACYHKKKNFHFFVLSVLENVCVCEYTGISSYFRSQSRAAASAPHTCMYPRTNIQIKDRAFSFQEAFPMMVVWNCKYNKVRTIPMKSQMELLHMSEIASFMYRLDVPNHHPLCLVNPFCLWMFLKTKEKLERKKKE